jgi:hypothetical protein
MKKTSIKNIIKEIIKESTNIKTTVVDSTGKPLLMYHGGSYTSGEFRGVAWFTTSKVDAQYYADQIDGNVTEAYLLVNNPLYVGHIKDLGVVVTKEMLDSVKKRNIGKGFKSEGDVVQFIEPNFGVLLAQDLGYDGVIDMHEGEILDVVVFNSDQIITINN